MKTQICPGKFKNLKLAKINQLKKLIISLDNPRIAIGDTRRKLDIIKLRVFISDMRNYNDELTIRQITGNSRELELAITSIANYPINNLN